MTTIRVTGRQKPACHLLASPLAQPLPSWLLMVPTLISSDPYSRFVRVANLSDEDVLLPARTPVVVLQAIDSVDSTDIQFTVGVSELVVSRETVCRSADSAPADHVPCPDYDGTSSQRKRLQELLTKHAAGFIKDKVRPGLHRSRPPSTPHHRLHSCGPAVQTHTSTPTAGGPRAHQGPAGTECHRQHPQSVCCTSGHRPQERRGNPPLRWLSQAQCKDSWWCLSSSEDPRVFWCAGRGPVLFDSGPGQRLPSNCHASRWHAQDRLRDADGAVRVYQNADGSVISASGLPTPHAVHDVRLHLPVPARVPGRSAGVLQDVWRAPCPPGPSSAAHHRRWSEAEDDKCQFLRRQVHYLGHIISAEGVSCEAGKVKAVKNWPVPATTTTLTSILGFASYYWHFIQGFSKIAGPPPWPGLQGQRTSQEEKGRHLQAIGPAAPEGVRRAEDSPDYSSCPGICWVHQALHPRDRRQPWRAERHPLSRSRWAPKGLGLRKSTAASHREEPGQPLQHEAGIPGP